MTEDSLTTAKRVDGFATESPIRAFTEFKVDGKYAIGKGFRPSLAHLSRYLDAMHQKEGWALSQIILPIDDATEPTIVFWKTNASVTMQDVDAYLREQGFSLVATPDGALRYFPERYDETKIAQHLRVRGYNPKHGDDDFGVEHEKPFLVEDDQGTHQVAYYSAGTWWQGHNDEGPDTQTEHPIVKVLSPAIATMKWPPYSGEGQVQGDPYKALADRILTAGGVPISVTSISGEVFDDPINPKHYAGRECADIGERLSANAYQILKYVWRLGKKDDPCVEIGKAIWYGDSESKLLKTLAYGQGHRVIRPNLKGLKVPIIFFEERIVDQPQFTQNIARMLWEGYNQKGIRAVNEALCEHRFHLDCGRGLAI